MIILYRTLKRCLLIMSFFILFIKLASAQQDLSPLVQKGFLGIHPVMASVNKMVEVQGVLPKSTAETLGLQTGDVLSALNQDNITNFSSLLTLLERITVGDKLSLLVKRNGQSIELKGTMQGRPREQSNTAKVEYGEVHWNNQRMRSITYTPNTVLAKKEKAPAIFYLQGYTCDSIDFGLFPQATSVQLINQFVAAGFIVHRVEKLNVGESKGSLKCAEIDFTTEVSAFVAGLKNLKQRTLVDEQKVYLWGHSLGVLFAPAMAKQEGVAGIIGYGGVFKPWYQYMLDIYQKQSVKYFSTPELVASRNVTTIKPFMHDWLNTDKPWHQVLNNTQAVNSNLIPINEEQVFDRHFTYFRDANRYDFAKIWQELQIPTLMIHGSLDIQAIDESWAFDIANAVNKGGKKLGKAIIVDGAEHGLMHYDSKAQYLSDRQNQSNDSSQLRNRYEPKIGELTINWIKESAH